MDNQMSNIFLVSNIDKTVCPLEHFGSIISMENR